MVGVARKPNPTASRPPVRLAVGLLAIIVSAILCAAYALSYPLNHDVGVYLHLAGEMLEGEGLYTSLIEVNPPLFIWLSMGPVLGESVTGLSAASIVEGLLLGLSLGSVAWSAWLAGSSDRAPRYMVVALAVGLMVALLVAPGIDFGQRGHVLFILTSPYLIVLWRRIVDEPVGRRVAVAVGLCAGLGFSAKPHYALIWAALEALWILRAIRSGGAVIESVPAAGRRLVRPEALTAAAVGATYVLSVVVIHPEYFGLLWEAREVYQGFAAKDRTAIVTAAYALAVLSGMLLVSRREGRLIELSRIYVVFAVAALLVLVLQGKGWPYHYYPTLAALIVLTCLAVGHLVALARASGTVFVQAASGLLLLASTGYLVAENVAFNRSERDARLDALARRTAFFDSIPGTQSLLILSDLVSDAFPLTNRPDIEWASPFPSTWWLQSAYERTVVTPQRFPPPARMGRIEREFSTRLVESLRDRRPDYVLLDTLPKAYYGGVPFPYLAYFGRWEDFRAAWRDYERVGAMDRFTVWRRGDPD